MKALLSTAPGGPETLELTDLPDPVPGPGQLLVRVKACAINYPDVLIIEDRYQFKPPRPFAPGGEIAGVVEALGEGVAGWSTGDRMIAMLGHGGLAEKVLVPAAAALPLPPERSFEDGSALILTYPRGPFDKDGSKALAQMFKDAVGPNGADVIYDPVGGDYAEPALRAIAWEGRYLVVGFPAGIPRLPLNLTLLKSCDVCGVFWGTFAARDPKANAAHIRTLFRLWEEGKIAPKVSRTWPLAQGGEAIAHMAARRAVGKLVVTME